MIMRKILLALFILALLPLNLFAAGTLGGTYPIELRDTERGVNDPESFYSTGLQVTVSRTARQIPLQPTAITMSVPLTGTVITATTGTFTNIAGTLVPGGVSTQYVTGAGGLVTLFGITPTWTKTHAFSKGLSGTTITLTGLATIGSLALTGGATTTYVRGDGSVATLFGITPTWTQLHTFSVGLTGTTATLTGNIKGGGYLSSDGSPGVTGDATAVDTVHFKNGLYVGKN